MNPIALALARGAEALELAQVARRAGVRLSRHVVKAATAEIAAARRELRAYESAGHGRRSEGWISTGASANAELQAAAPLLRNRSRDLVRNNPHAAKATAELVVGLVGDGIRGRSNTGDAKLDATVNALWRTWAAGECDVSNDLPFEALQTLAARAMFESGEVLVRRRWRREGDGLAVPLQLQILEADFLDGSRTSIVDDGGRRVQGVEFDPLDRRRAYWLFGSHPGDALALQGVVSKPIPATEIAHVFAATHGRPGQARGVPWLAAIAADLRDLDDYGQAERMRKKIEACLAAFVIGADESDADQGIAPSVVDATTGDKVEGFEPGMIAIATGTREIKLNAPAPAGGFGEYRNGELHDVAAGALVTFEQLTGDLSQVNYSSIRAGMTSFRATMRALRRHVFVPLFCARVWRWFVEAAITSGALPDRPGGYPVKWSEPRFEDIDREKEVNASLKIVRAGFNSRRAIVEAAGLDFDELNAEIDAEREADREAGRVFDSNPDKPVELPQSPGEIPNAPPPRRAGA